MASGIVFALTIASALPAETGDAVELRQDDTSQSVAVWIGGREAIVYQYGQDFAIPHYWPVRSPSGELLTAQRLEPYPHHRSLWIADKLQAAGTPVVDFYHCWQNYQQAGQPESGFRHFIRHRTFGKLQAAQTQAFVEAELQWIVNETRPVLDEWRGLRVRALGEGEYLIDLSWKLTAAHGDVRFLSDEVHYAWPYLRMHPQFSGERGGTIVNDQGGTGQMETNGRVAEWVDYSNVVEGRIEGLCVMIFPDGRNHDWLTREYGTFGPRRAPETNGTRFTLKSGESLTGRVGILIHRGDVRSGLVAERYRQYVEGKL